VIRTCFPTAVDHSEITAWPLMPAVDDPDVRKQRLDIYLSFSRPGRPRHARRHRGHGAYPEKLRDPPAGSSPGLLARHVARTAAGDRRSADARVLARLARRNGAIGTNGGRMTPGSADRELRAEVEHFLFEEAELLDSWRLNEWVELFTRTPSATCRRLTIRTETPRKACFLVADDLPRLRSRVRQLTGGPPGRKIHAHRRAASSTNVRVTSADGATVRATANFLVHRCRMERISTFAANTSTSSFRHNGSFKIASARWILAQDTLAYRER